MSEYEAKVSPTERLVSAATNILEKRLSRRGLFTRMAVVGSAVTTGGLDYILHPGTAYASVCGQSHNCSSGWTAMCCTINSGVNQCPPGSFAGGWWKADGASLCGGKARYYVDCQGECTNCGCHGGHYCGQSCWNCKPHCAHHGTCDERRVCHNLFRYGQCERQEHCSGPVLCRAISCTPPWKWANCSTASATDDFTVSHSAPCLPRWTRIQERYTALGSESSVLGATVRAEQISNRAHVQRYRHGRMYWTKPTGAHYLTGQVLRHYLAIGELASPIGVPVIDITTALDGVGERARFQHGGIYHRPNQAAHALFDDVADRYRKLNYEQGPLGYPTTDEQPAVDGQGVHGVEVLCQSGAIAMAAGHKAHGVWGPIYQAWNGQGRSTGELGFPITDVKDVTLPDGPGMTCNFEYGSATYDATTGAVSITLT